ncbi:2-dehydropantoate 2-reductase [Paraburkholderia sediminicola]|uniref:ketopantoate reductase family protein n=1 Tax=Paraburkholderia sediminicola TaxID=458836 RepID=UPI0038BA104C
MKISVLGAGAMGSLFGGLLAQDGHAVSLLDINAAHLDAIRERGLLLEARESTRAIANLSVSRPEAARSIPDLLIVFTKSLHTRVALSSLNGIIGPETLVLTLQNGLGNIELITEFVPIRQVLIGVTTWPADLIGPGQVSSHGDGGIRMMSADGVARPEVDAIAAALDSAGLCCVVDRNVWAAIWEKVAFNAALNSLCAVTGCAVDGLGAVPDGPQLAAGIVTEVLAVARARGIDADLHGCLANVSHAIETHHGHKPSMLQDVLAGRRTEIESINGAVVAAAREVGVPVTHTATMLQLVRLVEARAGHSHR